MSPLRETFKNRNRESGIISAFFILPQQKKSETDKPNRTCIRRYLHYFSTKSISQPNALATVESVSILKLYLPRSMVAIVEGGVPSFSASCFCVSPRFFLISFTRRPIRNRSGSGVRGCSLLLLFVIFFRKHYGRARRKVEVLVPLVGDALIPPV